jgi:hypothetical protein
LNYSNKIYTNWIDIKFKLIYSNIRIDFNVHKQITNVITALYLQGFGFVHFCAANVTVLVRHDASLLGNWFMTSYTSILEAAMTV